MMSQTNHEIAVAGQEHTYPPDLKGPAVDTAHASFPDPPPDRKRTRLYWDVIFRIVITLSLIGGMVGIVRGYEVKGLLTRAEKYAYNTLTILFSLLLGLNMTGIVFAHPREPSHRQYRISEKFLKITGLRSTLTFILYQRKASSPDEGYLSASSIFVVVWIIFNLSVAIAIGLIGLTYSLDEGGIGRRPGIVSIVDTRNFYVHKNNTETPELFTERFVAKLYSDISTSYKDTTPSHSGKDEEFDVEELDDGWQYNLREEDPNLSVRVRSDRYVKTNASCEPLKIVDWNSSTYILKYEDLNGKSSTVQNIILKELRTTYISELLNNNEIKLCGNDNPRCGWMLVIQMPDSNFHNAWMYDCHSTIGKVSGARYSQHQISDEIAVIAATSLSQSGLIDYGWSYGDYMNKVRWGEIANGDHRKIEKMLSRASAGALAAMDQMNPRMLVPGQQPWPGVLLRVRWERLIAVLVVIACLQLIGATATIIWHSKKLATDLQVSKRESPSPQTGGVPPATQSSPPNYADSPPQISHVEDVAQGHHRIG